jgi:hypothetical protein
MKSSPEVASKAKVHASKGIEKEKLGKVMNDPTLEGKDENKVGRIQRKSSRRTPASKSDGPAASSAKGKRGGRKVHHVV